MEYFNNKEKLEKTIKIKKVFFPQISRLIPTIPKNNQN